MTTPRAAARFAMPRLAALVFAALAACTQNPDWSPAEVENARHYYESLADNARAVGLARGGDPDAAQFGIETINRNQAAALKEAKLVDDAMLDKAHPELKRHFRTEYQKGLETILSSYGGASAATPRDQVERQAKGVALVRRWNEWLAAHVTELRLPARTTASAR